MELSYREKSLWVSLLAMVIVGSYFSASVVHFLTVFGADQSDLPRLLFKIVVAVIVIEVVLNVLLAMESQEGANEPEDEREKLFRYKSNEVGYWILSIGIVGCIVQEFITQQLLAMGGDFSEQDRYAALMTSSIALKLVVVFWISEFARFAVNVYYYRKGD